MVQVTDKKVGKDETVMNQIEQLISEMTLAEKASLCSGADFWHTEALDRLQIPAFMLTDGPNGLRKQAGKADHVGLNESIPATCFPTEVTLASSWNRALIEEVGAALGAEAKAEKVGVVLGPGANIKRSPLCGRNFEYYSEDPYLSSQLAKHAIQGIQSQGVGASVKHFAANNQEHLRMVLDVQVDERTLREIYLASFETAIKEGQPWTVMTAYNKVNGDYCAENTHLLKEILRDEWDFEGVVVSDWGGVDDRVASLEAGLDLEMPGNQGINDQKIIAAVQSGALSEAVVDTAVARILRLAFRVQEQMQSVTDDSVTHHQLARKAASESFVLLKNEAQSLPVASDKKVALIGRLLEEPRIQGGGSSRVNPTMMDTVQEQIHMKLTEEGAASYYPGYLLNEDTDADLIQEAVAGAAAAEIALVFLGLPQHYESEAYDRQHLQLPVNQTELLAAITEVQENVVVILANGGPIEMPWLSSVKGVLETYLAGQAMGGAVADVLFGDVNPSGKLAESFPMKLSHNPSFLNFPGEKQQVAYREGLFVGYRYYDKTETEVLFPFGHGLSYTNFEYRQVTVDRKELTDEEEVTVSVTIQNTGQRSGKEIVQLYVQEVNSQVIRPLKELKGFEKVALEAGEAKVVQFKLGKRAFAYYDETRHDWCVTSGFFNLLIGSSSQTILGSQQVYVTSTAVHQLKFDRNSLIGDLAKTPAGKQVLQQMNLAPEPSDPADSNDTQLMDEMTNKMPLRSLVTLSGGRFSEETLTHIIETLNANG